MNQSINQSIELILCVLKMKTKNAKKRCADCVADKGAQFNIEEKTCVKKNTMIEKTKIRHCLLVLVPIWVLFHVIVVGHSFFENSMVVEVRNGVSTKTFDNYYVHFNMLKLHWLLFREEHALIRRGATSNLVRTDGERNVGLLCYAMPCAALH